MDLKQLFHNPEDLDDAELAIIRDKIRFQQHVPYLSAFFTGLTMRIVDAHVFKSGARPLRIGTAAAFGFYIGATAANTIGSNMYRQFDKDIMRAFDERYLTKALNVSGWNTNYTGMKDNEDVNMMNKPY